MEAKPKMTKKRKNKRGGIERRQWQQHQKNLFDNVVVMQAERNG